VGAAIPELLGLTLGEAIAMAAGMATAPAVRPWIQDFANEAWKLHTVHPLAIGDAAEIAAQYRVFEERARHEAAKQGIDPQLMDNLILATREAPALTMLMELWRRDHITEAAFDFGLWKMKIAERFHEPIKATKNTLLSPADLAMMRQQGFIDVARQHRESELQGVTNERADLLFEISGLPPGVETAMEMWRRDIIDRGTFGQIVREGHTKTKYTAALEALKRALLNPATVVNLFLRGWIERGDYHDRMALHGYDAGEADDWYDASGRPATALQMVKGFRRGGRIPGVNNTEEAHVRKAVVQSDIRPEDFDVIWSGRETFPSAFVMRRLVSDGAVTEGEAADILYKNAWPRDLADKAAHSWAVGTGTTSKGLTATDLANEYEARWLTRAQYIAALRELGYSADNAAAKADAEDARRARAARNRRVELIGQRYVKHALSRDQAVAELTASEVPARVRDSLMPEWDAMRSITPDALTSAQIKKAFAKAQITRAEAVARLLAKGYEEADANIYLDQ
jgi:hypothetical protein